MCTQKEVTRMIQSSVIEESYVDGVFWCCYFETNEGLSEKPKEPTGVEFPTI